MSAAMVAPSPVPPTGGKTLWAHPKDEQPFLSLKKAFLIALILEVAGFGALYYISAGAAHKKPVKQELREVRLEDPPPPPPPPKVEKEPEPPKVEKIQVKPKTVQKEQPKDTTPVPIDRIPDAPGGSGNAIPIAKEVGEKTTTHKPVEKVEQPAPPGSYWVTKPKITMPREVMAELDEDVKCVISEMEVEADKEGKVINARYTGKTECPRQILDEVTKQVKRKGLLNPSSSELRRVSVPMEFKLSQE